MSNKNLVILIGRLTNNPKLFRAQYSAGVSFTLAINEYYKSKNSEDFEQSTQFISCVAFGSKQAEHISNKFQKGDLINVVGSLKTSQYVTKNGDVAYRTSVVVEQLSLLNKTSNKINIPNSKVYDDSNEFTSAFENSSWAIGDTQEVSSASDLTNEDDKPWELDL